MPIRPLSLSAALVLALAASFAIPEPVDARSSRRRNYAEELRRESLEEERREEREKARQEWMEHQAGQAERRRQHNADQQQRYLDHSGRQLDKILGNEPAPAAPPPARSTGTCIYGANDKVVYQPKGVTCEKR